MRMILKVLTLFSGAGGPDTTIANEILWDDGTPDAMAWDDDNLIAWDD